tara:strand:+ start:202 stop:393 length:192 start_codon:yes stop_codon:yes gene_type:complete
MTKAKRCPFCRSENVEVIDNGIAVSWVYCNTCEATGSSVYVPKGTIGDASRKKAIKKWNKAKR